ncbi:hypothetical protein chiPu_0020067 [Chiloscyllium punctatum]|uniref:Uncharacterized protein n=1 Tax=Chiloscyllium punctatum TaxID=137246 RepID=A0A401RTX8_CHIPU|nr:hypothetical protein [Chiloscyllium punctatum]
MEGGLLPFQGCFVGSRVSGGLLFTNVCLCADAVTQPVGSLLRRLPSRRLITGLWAHPGVTARVRVSPRGPASGSKPGLRNPLVFGTAPVLYMAPEQRFLGMTLELCRLSSTRLVAVVRNNGSPGRTDQDDVSPPPVETASSPPGSEELGSAQKDTARPNWSRNWQPVCPQQAPRYTTQRDPESWIHDI